VKAENVCKIKQKKMYLVWMAIKQNLHQILKTNIKEVKNKESYKNKT